MNMNELLKNLTPDVTFRPEDGPFRSKLVETALDKGDEEFAELFSESSSDIQVSLSGRSMEDAIIRFRVFSDQGEQTHKFGVSSLNKEEVGDLTEQLSRLLARPSSPAPQDGSKIIIRKRAVEGMLDIHQASQKLGCSTQFLKSKIPCSDYTYTEVEGKKEIQGYYWSQELMDRLCQIKSNGVKPEDIKYIADQCCDGDRPWTEEILASLNAPKTTPKGGGASPQGAPRQPAKTGSRDHSRPPRRKQP